MIKYLILFVWHAFALKIEEEECADHGKYCYEYKVDRKMVCNCPSDVEIGCDKEGGWWYSSTYENYSYCEWPSKKEKDCKE